jgi:transglutaminase-like putative cysteine protease
MDRRFFLSAAALSVGGGVLSRAARAETQPGWRRFEITTRVTLLDAPGAAQLWLPLAQTAGGYQTGIGLRSQSTGHAAIVPDSTYGADILRVLWDGASDAPKTVEIVQTVATRDRDGADRVLPVTEAERRFWLQPTESTPTDGIVRATAERIVTGKSDPRARLRAIYDWVVDNTTRNPATPGCGLGDIKAMLESGNLAGKCADINGLMTGLARAAGFPARDVYGIRVADSRRFGSLGASGVITKAQHCRSEVYLEDAGWFPVDPADVRKVVLERKLAVDSPEIRALRDRLFGAWEMNWVGYNSATDIVLPGAAESQKPNFAFLMYPCAFTATGQPDCLDPAHYRYEITSREVTA